MIKKIEHLGIAVKNLAESEKVFERLLGADSYKQEGVESEDVKVDFFKVGESKIELLEGGERSAIKKYLDKGGKGIHHLAFETDDIHHEIKRLKDEGFEFINEQPKKGADNKLICFLHPKLTSGVLIELCQEIA